MPLPLNYHSAGRKTTAWLVFWRGLFLAAGLLLPVLLGFVELFYYLCGDPVGQADFRAYHFLAFGSVIFWLSWLVAIHRAWRTPLGRALLVACLAWSVLNTLATFRFLRHVRNDDPAGQFYSERWP